MTVHPIPSEFPIYEENFLFFISVAWRADTTTLCQSQLYPPVMDYEFGYKKPQKLAFLQEAIC